MVKQENRPAFMDQDEAEFAIWSFYWQLDNHRDRRIAPVITEPGQLSKKELEEIRDRQIPLWRKVQLKGVDMLERRSSRAGGYARKLAGLFTTKAELDYIRECVFAEEMQKYADTDLTGKVDPRTGLPWTTNDIQSGGRGVIAGQDLCLEAIIPPIDMAESATAWLPPCPPDENEAEWGSDLSHWQSLAYKPKDKFCTDCGGTGKVTKTVTAEVRRGFLFRRTKSEQRSFLAVCETCGGAGCRPDWDDDEVAAIRHNAAMIAQVVHELSKKGYFDLRPINERDAEMGDLVWERKDGLTIGYRLNWEGYKYMKEYTDKHPEIQRVLHVLTMAGKDVRSEAPKWAQDEYNKTAAPIVVQSGSFDGAEAGGLEGATGGSFEL